MNCSDAEPRLGWVLDGEAPDVAEHAMRCAECRAKLEKLREADPLLAEAARRWADDVPEARVTSARGSWGRRAAVAAAAVMVSWLGAWGWMNVRRVPEQDVTVIGAQVWSAGAENTVRVLVRNGRTGAPVSGAGVRADIAGGGTAEAVSGADGSAELRLRAPDGDQAMILFTIVSSAGSDRIERSMRLERPVRVMLTTDKPVYQPEQTIHMRALALNTATSRPHAGDVVFDVQDAAGRRVFRKTVRSSEFGVASTDLDLADEVTTGSWKITARAGGVASERTVEVKRYVLPKFRVGLGTDRTFYGPGERISAAIDSDYFFGKPLAGALARVELSVWTVNRFEDVAVARALLDAEGRASVELDLPDTAFGTSHAGEAATARLQAFVTDGAGHEESKSMLVPVTNRPIRLHAIPESGQWLPGVAQHVFVLATYADGRPARVDLHVEGLEAPLRTDGAGMATVPLSSPSFSIRATDRAGREGVLRTDFATLATDRDFLLRTGKSELRGGETLHLDVLSRRDGTVYVDLIKGGQTWLTRSLEIRDRRGALDIDLPAELSGTVRVLAYRIGEDGNVSRDERLVLVVGADDLTIRTGSSKSEYRPGEDVEISFEVVGRDGKPVPSALGLAVVDEAVFSVHEARPGMEGVFFRIEEDLLKPRAQLKFPGLAPPASAPFSMRSAAAALPADPTLGRARYDTRVAKYARELRRFNDGSAAALGLLVGLGILGAVVGLLETSLKNMTARDFWIWSVLLLVVLGLGVLFVPALSAARKSDRAVVAALAALEGAAGPDAMPATTFKGKPGNSSSPRLREFFPETLYWNPQIITDDAGRATVRFQAADSITTWRMAMSGVSRDGRLGGADASLRVFQPFFADIDLPVALTQGDEVWIPVALYNYLPEAQTVKLTFEAESGFELLDPAERTIEVRPDDVTSVRFHVRARDFGRHAIRVAAVGSKFSDAVRRQVDVYPDGREVPFVVSDGLQRKSAAKIVIPPDAVEGASRAWVRVFPSRFSEVVTGLEGLIRLPHG
jgi:hypothetical protein